MLASKESIINIIPLRIYLFPTLNIINSLRFFIITPFVQQNVARMLLTMSVCCYVSAEREEESRRATVREQFSAGGGGGEGQTTGQTEKQIRTDHSRPRGEATQRNTGT